MRARWFFLVFIFGITACSAASSTMPNCSSSANSEQIYVLEQGWHVEIGLPVDELDDTMAFYRSVFPGASYLMFGYGKKTFFIAPAKSVSDYILGPFPGDAAIQVVALKEVPTLAYAPDDVVTIAVPQGGSKAISKFIWDDLSKDEQGKPIILAPSTDPSGEFYAAQSEYNILHTCNTWAVEALQASGLSLKSDDVVFSGQAMSRVQDAKTSQCFGQN